ncbi:MAG: hypothetical protein LVS60_09800 [Nodosilinea sp. LVE1205-7]
MVDQLEQPQRVYEMTQPVILVRHKRRFRTRISREFEAILMEGDQANIATTATAEQESA